MNMKELKDVFIKVRVTKSEKDVIAAYCERHGMSVSELIRRAVENYLKEH